MNYAKRRTNQDEQFDVVCDEAIYGVEAGLEVEEAQSVGDALMSHLQFGDQSLFEP